MAEKVITNFEPRCQMIQIELIWSPNDVHEIEKKKTAYRAMNASIIELGLVEPIVVARVENADHPYVIMDGVRRFHSLRQRGEREIFCLVSTVDDYFSYNNRICPVAANLQTSLVRAAIKHGADQHRMARALDIDIPLSKDDEFFTKEIDDSVLSILKEHKVGKIVYLALKQMTPERQIRSVRLMQATNNFGQHFAAALLASTPRNCLRDRTISKAPKTVSEEEIAEIEKGFAKLEKFYHEYESSHFQELLGLASARGYLRALLKNRRVSRYLKLVHPELKAKWQDLAKAASR